MTKVTFEQMLNAGVHFGHLKRKWNPSMSPYIFDEKKGIHVIDLNKTLIKLEEASSAMKQIAKSGRKILFVATKKQAKEIMSTKVEEVNMPSITERWPGGLLTNFKTTRKTIKKMTSIDKMMKDGTADTMSKRERLQLTRKREKIDKIFGKFSLFLKYFREIINKTQNNINTNIEVSLASQAHQVPQVGFPQIDPVTIDRHVNNKPIGAKLFINKNRFLILNKKFKIVLTAINEKIESPIHAEGT